MNAEEFVIAALLIAYGAWAISDYIRTESGAPGTNYYNLQGLLSGIMAIFLAVCILVGGIHFNWL